MQCIEVITSQVSVIPCRDSGFGSPSTVACEKLMLCPSRCPPVGLLLCTIAPCVQPLVVTGEPIPRRQYMK